MSHSTAHPNSPRYLWPGVAPDPFMVSNCSATYSLDVALEGNPKVRRWQFVILYSWLSHVLFMNRHNVRSRLQIRMTHWRAIRTSFDPL